MSVWEWRGLQGSASQLAHASWHMYCGFAEISKKEKEPPLPQHPQKINKSQLGGGNSGSSRPPTKFYESSIPVQPALEPLPGKRL